MSEAPKRRLPTKTRSGIITLPPPPPEDEDEDTPMELEVVPSAAQLLSARNATRIAEDDDDELTQAMQQAAVGKSCLKKPAVHSDDSTARPETPPRSVRMRTSLCDSQSCESSADAAACEAGPTGPAQCLDASPVHPEATSPSSQDKPKVSFAQSGSQQSQKGTASTKSGLPPVPAKFTTGPLNASTAPAVVSLPVKRRGSYQSLKKACNPGASPIDTALKRKATHWEKFGTIMVLHCAADKSCQNDGGVLQMMLAEGYDTDVVDCQADVLTSFNSKEVYPDMVLIDADHSYNTLQLLKQLQAQQPTVAIIVLGSAHSRPSSVTALQAGASDYMRKPVDVEELMARIERHVQRQHCIKLEMEQTIEQVQNMVAKMALTKALQEPVQPQQPNAKQAGLISVAETDFEDQMSELCEENARLAARLAELERQLELHQHRRSREFETSAAGSVDEVGVGGWALVTRGVGVV